jgi:hypothetical protein
MRINIYIFLIIQYSLWLFFFYDNSPTPIIRSINESCMIATKANNLKLKYFFWLITILIIIVVVVIKNINKYTLWRSKYHNKLNAKHHHHHLHFLFRIDYVYCCDIVSYRWRCLNNLNIVICFFTDWYYPFFLIYLYERSRKYYLRFFNLIFEISAKCSQQIIRKIF